jgi:hypothetical protein
MQNSEVLTIIRDALQTEPGGKAKVSLTGFLPQDAYSQNAADIFQERLEYSEYVTENELGIATRMIDAVSLIHPMVEDPYEVGTERWCQQRDGMIRRNVGRMAVAFDRAAERQLFNADRVDVRSFVARFAAEVMVVTSFGRGFQQRDGVVSVYMSPFEIARLRRDYPSMAPGLFAEATDKGMRTKRLLPELLHRITEEGVTLRGAYTWIPSTLAQLKQEEVG